MHHLDGSIDFDIILNVYAHNSKVCTINGHNKYFNFQNKTERDEDFT